MSIVDEYVAAVAPAARGELERICAIARRLVPDAEEGLSYAMPAFKYEGKAFLSVREAKKHLSLYPFSGKVIDKLQAELSGFEVTAGSIHFSPAHSIPDELVERIIKRRLEEIDATGK